MKDFSVVIPTYHEAKNIPELVNRFSKIDFGDRQFEVILVDDNSQDGITDICARYAIQYPWLKLIVRNAKKSLSKSVIEGFKQANYPIIVSMDADLSHPPEKIMEMIAALNDQQTTFVIGSRYITGGNTDEKWPLSRRLTSKLAASLARIVTPTAVKDPLSGFFALKKDSFLAADPLKPLGWKIGLELMIKCRCAKIDEIPIHFSQRHAGKSKINHKIAIAYFFHVLRLLVYKIKSTL